MATSDVNQSRGFTKLLEQLPIVTEATTSRVVVNNKVLRHVLFSMDAGQVLTEHSSPRAVIVNCLSGKISFDIGSQSHTMQAGDVIYLAPNERHAVLAEEPCHMSLTLVDVAETKGAADA